MSNGTPTTLRERIHSPLTWHYAGAGVLLLLVIGLAVRFAMDLSETGSSSAAALAGKQVQRNVLERQTSPLRGLDQRIDESRSQMKDFYAKRIPANYSSISASIGELEAKSGVHVSGLQYGQGVPTGDLTEIALDARITGEYSQIMRFVNGLERDKNFFVIRAMALTGQQGGLVNLRLRVSTWLRAADAAAGSPPQAQQQQAPAEGAPSKEGQ